MPLACASMTSSSSASRTSTPCPPSWTARAPRRAWTPRACWVTFAPASRSRRSWDLPGTSPRSAPPTWGTSPRPPSPTSPPTARRCSPACPTSTAGALNIMLSKGVSPVYDEYGYLAGTQYDEYGTPLVDENGNPQGTVYDEAGLPEFDDTGHVLVYGQRYDENGWARRHPVRRGRQPPARRVGQPAGHPVRRVRQLRVRRAGQPGDQLMSTRAIRPKVSVIMPVFRVEAYVGRAIESILNQDARRLRVLDRRRRLARPLRRDLRRVRPARPAHPGVPPREQRGSRRAQLRHGPGARGVPVLPGRRRLGPSHDAAGHVRAGARGRPAAGDRRVLHRHVLHARLRGLPAPEAQRGVAGVLEPAGSSASRRGGSSRSTSSTRPGTSCTSATTSSATRCASRRRSGTTSPSSCR